MSSEVQVRRLLSDLFMIGLPSVVVVSLWIGIWFYWPDRDITPDVNRAPFQTKVRIVHLPAQADYHMPDVFARMPAKGSWQTTNHVNGPDLDLVLPAASPPRYLESSSPVSTDQVSGIVNGSTNGIWFGQTRWDTTQTFAGRSGTVHSVIIELGSALQTAGFSFRVPSMGNMPAAGRAWEVLFSVDLNDRGMVEHLFMEKGSGIADIDRLFSDLILQGKAAKISEGMRGSIRIRLGVQPGPAAAEVLK